MRALLVTFVVLAAVGCGGPEDEALTPEQAAAVAAQRAALGMQLEEDVPLPDESVTASVIAARALQEQQVLLTPVEERFFYPVAPTAAPVLPAPRCPACR